MRSRALLVAIFIGASWQLSDTRARGQDVVSQREIDQAIERGVQYLRGIQQKDGRWPYAPKNAKINASHADAPERTLGATALAAWTLLECGAKADDPNVQRAAEVLRGLDGLRTNYTYAMALAILFFDRLGDPVDEPLIQSLALRLMICQTSNGGWWYSVKSREPPPFEIERLRKHYEQVRNGTAARQGTSGSKELPVEIRRQLESFFVQGPSVYPFPSDNSNTQFAIQGLWAARRHGMPVDLSLSMAAKRFRATQNPLGCWGYDQFGPEPVDENVIRARIGRITAMTCAGLIGIALGSPASTKSRKQAVGTDLTKDRQVEAGLAAVAALIGTPQADRRKVPRLLFGDASEGARDHSCYCLWTLMRMARIYDRKTLGTKDWYAWGAQILVENQQGDGSWKSDCPWGGADTAFALLFLKRANAAQDFTDTLKGKVRDPGKASPQLLQMIGKEPGARERSRQIPQGASEVGNSHPAVPPEDAAKLGSELSGATPAQQETLLEKLRDSPGSAFTQALAGAIPKLRGTAKSKARQALAQRFEREEVEGLRTHLTALEAEVRRAAAMAAGAKKVRELGPDLVRLLVDHEVTVQQAARAGLRQISGQDFGPEVDASPAERMAAIEAWRRWCKQQKQ